MKQTRQLQRSNNTTDTPERLREDVLSFWIKRRVAAEYGLNPRDLLGGGSRGRRRCEARGRAAYLLNAVCGLSGEATGRALDQDRRSIIRTVARIEANRDDPVLDAVIEGLSQEIGPLLAALDGWAQLARARA